MDHVDRVILGLLQEDGRLSYRELAERVGLGPTAARERVARLVASGTITGFAAVVDPAAIGLSTEAITEVTLRPDVSRDEFEAAVADDRSIVDACHVTGPSDYILRLVCEDTTALDAKLLELKDRGVLQSNSRVVLRRVR